ncbi:torsin-1A-interacting protein 2-like isoform X2 [Myripristis murdjan]|uniref:torsin-1A-interacting protein 2-like isoform X2 n=1 Tax=Myripristis murdjan TaxID=586833 RepID=UPI0011761BA5|nr:torsin-1A-interacting protein 2-like isoform X2 [Myripristis murdjan]
MEVDVSGEHAARPTRRSTRKSAAKEPQPFSSSSALNVELTPRGPLKRTRRRAENQVPPAAVNGSKDEENASEDEDSPSKKSRLETEGEVADNGIDENEMEVQEADENLEKNEDQEMISEEAPSQNTHQQKPCPGPCGDKVPRVMLERYPPVHAEDQDTNWTRPQRVQPSRKEQVASNKSAPQLKQPENRHVAAKPIITSAAQYNPRIPYSAVIHRPNRVLRPCPLTEVTYTTKHVTDVPIQKQSLQQRRQGKKTSAVIKGSSGFSSGGRMRYLWGLLLLVLLSSAVLLAYKNVPAFQRQSGAGFSSRSVKPGVLAAQLSILETQFPSQRPELWKRSRIHLEKHLQTAQPTEPVSLILTAGTKAEGTLRCLAQALASAFSAALNSSVLHIDGASKANQDSDQVKLDIDSQLRAAFEGDKPVAVVHRFDELPPASTLIFYRYCDHENAAYKQVFLAFTVLLPQEDVEGSLRDVEEKVLDYVQSKFVSPSNQTGFNRMDLDKFGGLWSRISHLILPVTTESEVEYKGC